MKSYQISPFPGMNPYVESPVHWSDFHHEFISSIREAINDRLPEPYYARVTELVMMVSPVIDTPQKREPDVLIGRTGFGGTDGGTAAAAVAMLEPEQMFNPLHDDPHTETYIEILRMPERDVVTVIELLSPTNKYGDGRGLYLQKRSELLKTHVNIFELDLLRAGRRLALNRRLPDDDYFCFISRGDKRPACDVYHWSVRDPMPTLPIPLRPPDVDVRVDFAGPFKTAFARGQYGRFIDYNSPPDPPLAGGDADWFRSVVKPASTA